MRPINPSTSSRGSFSWCGGDTIEESLGILRSQPSKTSAQDVQFAQDGYPFDSPGPKGLCFGLKMVGVRVNDLAPRDRIDSDSLLC